MDTTEQRLESVFIATTMDCIYTFVVAIVFTILYKHDRLELAVISSFILLFFKWLFVANIMARTYEEGFRSGANSNS